MLTNPASAAGRLIAIAQRDTGQSRRVADFLLAWWNGGELGHFPIEHLWNVDQGIATDMLEILAFLSEQPSAVYADALGYDAELRALVERWRPEVVGDCAVSR